MTDIIRTTRPTSRSWQFTAADAPLRARAVCEAMDLEITPSSINNVRLKLKRLAERGGRLGRADERTSFCRPAEKTHCERPASDV
ncbi:hypothetical protein [Streptomyces sp. NPDC001070]